MHVARSFGHPLLRLGTDSVLTEAMRHVPRGRLRSYNWLLTVIFDLSCSRVTVRAVRVADGLVTPSRESVYRLLDRGHAPRRRPRCGNQLLTVTFDLRVSWCTSFTSQTILRLPAEGQSAHRLLAR